MAGVDLSVASLFGDDHAVFGEVSVADLGGGSGVIAISKGRYPKGYATLDANEDAVMVARVNERALLAVADGHWGFDAARAAISSLSSGAGSLLEVDAGPEAIVRAALGRAVRSVRDVLDRAPDPRSGSRTTLTVACVSHGMLSAGGFGDSRAVVLRDGAPRPVWHPAPFLGRDTDPAHAWIERPKGVPGSRIAVMSDGLTDFLGRRWPERLAGLVDLPLDEFAAGAIEAAFEGGAGDHISIAAVDSDHAG